MMRNMTSVSIKKESPDILNNTHSESSACWYKHESNANTETDLKIIISRCECCQTAIDPRYISIKTEEVATSEPLTKIEIKKELSSPKKTSESKELLTLSKIVPSPAISPKKIVSSHEASSLQNVDFKNCDSFMKRKKKHHHNYKRRHFRKNGSRFVNFHRNYYKNSYKKDRHLVNVPFNLSKKENHKSSMLDLPWLCVPERTSNDITDNKPPLVMPNALAEDSNESVASLNSKQTSAEGEKESYPERKEENIIKEPDGKNSNESTETVIFDACEPPGSDEDITVEGDVHNETKVEHNDVMCVSVVENISIVQEVPCDDEVQCIYSKRKESHTCTACFLEKRRRKRNGEELDVKFIKRKCSNKPGSVIHIE